MTPEDQTSINIHTAMQREMDRKRSPVADAHSTETNIAAPTTPPTRFSTEPDSPSYAQILDFADGTFPKAVKGTKVDRSQTPTDADQRDAASPDSTFDLGPTMLQTTMLQTRRAAVQNATDAGDTKVSQTKMTRADFMTQKDAEDRAKDEKRAKRAAVRARAAELAKLKETEVKQEEFNDTDLSEQADHATPTADDLDEFFGPSLPTEKRAPDDAEAPPSKRARTSTPATADAGQPNKIKIPRSRMDPVTEATEKGREAKQKKELREKIVLNAYWIARGEPERYRPTGKLQHEIPGNRTQTNILYHQGLVVKGRKKEACKNAPCVKILNKADIQRKLGGYEIEVDSITNKEDPAEVRKLRRALTSDAERPYLAALEKYTGKLYPDLVHTDPVIDAEPAAQVIAALTPPPGITQEDKFEYTTKIAELRTTLADRDRLLKEVQNKHAALDDKRKAELKVLRAFKADHIEAFQAWEARLAQEDADAKQAAADELADLERMKEKYRKTQQRLAARANKFDHHMLDGAADENASPFDAINAAIEEAGRVAKTAKDMLKEFNHLIDFANEHDDDFKVFKQRRARDVYAELTMAKRKVDMLEEEYTYLAEEDLNDIDYAAGSADEYDPNNDNLWEGSDDGYVDANDLRQELDDLY